MQAKRSTKRRDERRAQIVRAVRELIVERGYAGAGVKDVMDGLGVARSLFYHYFDDLDAAVDAVLDERVKAARERARTWREGIVSGDTRGALSSGLPILREALLGEDDLSLALRRPGNAAVLMRLRERISRELARLLAQTDALGRGRSEDGMYVLVYGLMALICAKPELTALQLEELAAGLLV